MSYKLIYTDFPTKRKYFCNLYYKDQVLIESIDIPHFVLSVDDKLIYQKF